MLFDIGWPELLLIGVVALVVIGPKDLPRALRVAGFWVRKARTMSREFQSSVEQMIHEAELDDVRRELTKVTDFDVEREFQKTIDADGSLAQTLNPQAVPDHFEEAPALPPPAMVSPALPPPAAGEPLHSDAATSPAPETADANAPGEARQQAGVPEFSTAEPPAPRQSEPPKP